MSERCSECGCLQYAGAVMHMEGCPSSKVYETARRTQLDRAEHHAQKALTLLTQSESAGNAMHTIGRALVHAVLAHAAATAARGE